MREAPRVALLGREGGVRVQLRGALAEIGAQIVAEGDPQTLTLEEVAGWRPDVLLVSLEPAIEDALERFGPLLADPAIEVIYDDAEVTGKLSGWDLARWTRHLAAKLLGRDEVLPPVPGAASGLDFANLELAPLDTAPSAAATDQAAAALVAAEFADGGLSLEPMSSAATRAIVLVAGLGGPDAVRQFLAALPDTLAVPVLLAQHLDAGKHDRLVAQLGKTSRLPVYLAEHGQAARAAQVAVLPARLGVRADAYGLRFVAVDGDEALLRALGAGSVAVLLSGADTAAVEPAVALAANGGLALAQDPAVCFDPTAARALAERGAPAAAPAQLAAQAAAHFASVVVHS